jgi:hypothetical protein
MKDISKAAPDLDKVMNGLYQNALQGWLSDLKSDAVSPKRTGDFISAWNIEGQQSASGLKIDYRNKYTISNPLDYAEILCFGNPVGSYNWAVKDPNWFPSYWNGKASAVLTNAVKKAESEL